MQKPLLNEAERFLVERWAEARLLEESIDAVRTKYKEVFQRIIGAVTEAHPELDSPVAYPTQFYDSGYIGFGRKSWPNDPYGNPSGLWVGNLRLELLTAEDSDPPYACIWASKGSDLDFDAARGALKEAANKLLTPEESQGAEIPESGEELLFLAAPSKHDLLTAFCESDGQAFVGVFVSQFDLMARFVPVLDRIFHDRLAYGALPQVDSSGE